MHLFSSLLLARITPLRLPHGKGLMTRRLFMSTKRTASEVLKDARKLVVERMKRGGVNREKTWLQNNKFARIRRIFTEHNRRVRVVVLLLLLQCVCRIENARKTLNEYWSSFSSSNSKLSRRTQQQRLNQQNHPTAEAEAGVEEAGPRRRRRISLTRTGKKPSK